jgi:hypothetical protein
LKGDLAATAETLVLKVFCDQVWKSSFRSLTGVQNAILSEVKVSGNISHRQGAKEEEANGCAHNIALCLQNDTKMSMNFFFVSEYFD